MKTEEEMISLRYNQIEDIRPLGNMRGLYYLNLRHNNICDISILSRFKDYYIGRLFLKYNPIDNFSPLKNVHLVDSDVPEYTGRAGFIIGQKVNFEEDESSFNGVNFGKCPWQEIICKIAEK